MEAESGGRPHFTEQPEGDRRELVRVNPALDRTWMESLGCEWPLPDQEEVWLRDLNTLVELSSENLRNEESASRELIEEQRETFYRMFNRSSRGEFVDSGGTTLIPPTTFIQAARFLHNQEFDLSRCLLCGQCIFAYRPITLASRIEQLTRLGLNGLGMAQREPRILTLAPESIKERVQPMLAVGRFVGWPDYRQRVADILKRVPYILTYRSDRTRMIGAAILRCKSFNAAGFSEANAGQLASLYRQPPRAIAAAYLRHGGVVRTVKALTTHADRLGRTWSEASLEGLIAEHANDPVVKIYMRWNPIEDPEAAAHAYQRHVHARERRRREWDERFDRSVESLAQNLLAAMAEGESLPAERAFTIAAREVPTLLPEQEIVLAERIRVGHAAARELQSKQNFEPGEQERLARAGQRGRQARNDLVRANLDTVIRATGRYRPALRYNSTLDVLDLVQAGSIGLLAAAEEFDPTHKHQGQTFAEYARDKVKAAIRKEYVTQSRTVTLPRDTRALANSMFQTRDEYLAETGRPPTTSQLAQLLGISEQRAAELHYQTAQIGSLDAPIAEGGGTAWADFIAADADTEPSEHQARTSFGQALIDHIQTLPTVYRQIISWRFYGGATTDEIAARLGEPTSEVQRMEAEALARLRKHSGALIQAAMSG